MLGVCAYVVKRMRLCSTGNRQMRLQPVDLLLRVALRFHAPLEHEGPTVRDPHVPLALVQGSLAVLVGGGRSGPTLLYRAASEPHESREGNPEQFYFAPFFTFQPSPIFSTG